MCVLQAASSFTVCGSEAIYNHNSISAQVRRYTGSQVVREAAEELYRKLKSLFLFPGRPALKGARQGQRARRGDALRGPVKAVQRVERGGKAPSAGHRGWGKQLLHARQPSNPAVGTEGDLIPTVPDVPPPLPASPASPVSPASPAPLRRSTRERGQPVDYCEPVDMEEKKDQTVPS